jgi:gluconokinase
MKGMVRAVRDGFEKAGLPAERCAGLSIGGAMHSLILLDPSGKPLTGVSTWADGRAAPQAAAVRDSPLRARLYRETGCVPHSMYPLYKILRLREEFPETYEKAARFVSAKEYVLYRLTGHHVVDYSIASGSGLLNIHRLGWNETSLELAGITPAHLSSLCDPRQSLGPIQPHWADQMGIPPRTPLIVGSSDAVNSSIGAGAIHPWQITCMVGTSGAIRRISPQPILDENGRCWCYGMDRNHWISGGAIHNGGIVLSWFRDLLHQPFPDLGPGQNRSFDDLALLAADVRAGAEGIVCLPFFAGERSPNWNLNASAAFFGLTLRHGVEHLARALLEGVAFRLRSVMERVARQGEEVRQVRASGGFTRSPLWLQIVSDVLNRELAVPRWGETSCLGAAFWALVATGAFKDIEEAAAQVETQEVVRPADPEVQIYDALYALYGDLYQALSPFFDRAARLQQDPRGPARPGNP